MKNSELPKIRIPTDLRQRMLKALDSMNQNESGLEISLADFRRLAYSYFSDIIRVEGFGVMFTPNLPHNLKRVE